MNDEYYDLPDDYGWPADKLEIQISIRVGNGKTWHIRTHVSEKELLNAHDPRQMIKHRIHDAVESVAKAATDARWGNGLEKAILRTK